MLNKKAQEAMEFLMTYGWAIIVVLVAIGALAYFGVLGDSSKFQCNNFPEGCICELTCQEVYEDNYDTIFLQEYKEWKRICEYEETDSNDWGWTYDRYNCYKQRLKTICEKDPNNSECECEEYSTPIRDSWEEFVDVLLGDNQRFPTELYDPAKNVFDTIIEHEPVNCLKAHKKQGG